MASITTPPALEALREVPTVAETEGYLSLDAAYEAYQVDLDASTVYCSICDGIGHGQPGYGPCPVFEDTGRGPDPDEGFRF